MYDRQMINGLTASLRREVSTHLLSLSVLRISIFLEPGMSFQHGHKGVRLLEYQLRLLPLLIPWCLAQGRSFSTRQCARRSCSLPTKARSKLSQTLHYHTNQAIRKPTAALDCALPCAPFPNSRLHCSSVLFLTHV